MGEMDVFFQQLFYGTGSYLGVLIILSLVIGLTMKWKQAGLLMIPICVFSGINYFDNGLGWHGIIMFFSACFIMAYLAMTRK